MNRFKKWYRQWNLFRFGKHSLESILLNPPSATSAYRQKRAWVLDLLDWIHERGLLDPQWVIADDSIVLSRVVYLLWSLERSENLRKSFAQTIQSVLQQAQALELLVNTGLPNHGGLISELIERLHFKIFPQAPQDHDLSALASEAFSGQSDVSWLRRLSPAAFHQFATILSSESLNQYFESQIEDAIVLLTVQIQAGGFSVAIRERLNQKDLRDMPFFGLETSAQQLCDAKDPGTRKQKAHDLLQRIELCFQAMTDVYSHLNDYGVSVSIVYHMDRLKMQLSRARTLVNLLVFDQDRMAHLQDLLATLVEDLAKSRSIRALFSENLSLLSKKISDRSAETGEHYISRDGEELRIFFRRALGGGFLTAFTVLIKYTVLALPFAPFLLGTLAALNYAVSFVLIQLFGFTLATKQPAMTATTLAAKMEHLSNRQAVDDLITEIIHLLRSQVVAVIGNLVSVIPVVAFLDILIFYSLGHHMIDPHHAEQSIEAVTLMGLAVPFAAFTGVLLFASSQVAGWMDNWWVFRKMGPALRHNRKLQFIFSERGAARIALFFSKNIGGLSGNISLGIFLGLFPAIFKFLGLPLDIRHVTLSTGMLTAAIASLGIESMESWNFTLAVFGILGIGIANVVGAFTCSMLVALRAREVKAVQRQKIYRAFLHRIFKRSVR